MQFRRFTLLNLHDTQKYAQNYYRMTISMISKIKLHDIVKKKQNTECLAEYYISYFTTKSINSFD